MESKAFRLEASMSSDTPSPESDELVAEARASCRCTKPMKAANMPCNNCLYADRIETLEARLELIRSWGVSGASMVEAAERER